MAETDTQLTGLITVQRARERAAVLGHQVSERTIVYWLHQGWVRGTRIAGIRQWLVDVKSLQAHLTSRPNRERPEVPA